MTQTQTLSSLVNDINSKQTIEENVYKLADYLVANYNLRGYNSSINVTVNKGRKYFKVIVDNSVNCFVDINNGHVFKPASWNKPAPIVRYNLLLNPQDCFNKCDWAGGYLYLR
tara:strand:- start:143 stop:481 length:339 start_codon:yes stop_codon:yes gene_type:complete